MAVKIMEKLSASEIEYQQYLAREKYMMDEMSKKKYAEYKMKQAVEEGLAKGLEQGLKQGIEQGIEQGLQRGLERGEKKKSIEIAKNLLDILDDETIALKTGLTVEEIKNIRKESNNI